MIWRLRLMAAFVLVLAVPLGIALLFVDAPLSDELIIFGVAVLIGVGASVGLSAVLARPLRQIAEAADRLAGDDLETAAVVRISELELGEVARSFNRLRDKILQQGARVVVSSSEMRESVRRLGDALRSTHDMQQMLSVVLETALVAVQGRAGAVFLLSARRSDLYIKVGRHLDPAIGDKRPRVGDGLAGWVAAHNEPAVFPGERVPMLGDAEPVEATALAVPLESQSQLLGVLAIYGRTSGRSFRDEDLDVITSLARQAGIGIENVLLHQEAQRLSITDGLTGIWNRRFFQMRLAQEFERANRFDRPFSLLMIDIDHFKDTNDRFGHQRGDAVLVELAQRVLPHTTRQVDTLARYGGEEFVLVLPETGEEGARIVGEKICAAIAATPFGGDGEQPVQVTVSIGYAVYPDHGVTADALVHAADRAMYLAKARGRNAVAGAGELDEGSDLAPDPSSS